MRVVLVQLPVPALVAQEVTGNTPLAGATLALYARRAGGEITGSELCLPEVQNRAGDAALIAHLASRAPDAIGFTCAVWNIERTLHVARGVRELLPRTQIWFGGPEIAADNAFLREPDAPFDCAVEGEGERAFALLGSGVVPSRIGGAILPGGARGEGGSAPAILDSLDAVHDPFCSGLVAPEADGVVLAECARGCAHRCIFCRYHHGRGRGAQSLYQPRRCRVVAGGGAARTARVRACGAASASRLAVLRAHGGGAVVAAPAAAAALAPPRGGDPCHRRGAARRDRRGRRSRVAPRVRFVGGGGGARGAHANQL